MREGPYLYDVRTERGIGKLFAYDTDKGEWVKISEKLGDVI